MKFGLTTTTIQRINQVFASFPAIRIAILYGSRAKGTHRAGSDIDLTLLGEGLTSAELNRVNMRLDALLLPYFFDLSIYERINTPELTDHIRRAGKVFYSKPPGITQELNVL